MQQDGALGEILLIQPEPGRSDGAPGAPRESRCGLPENTVAVLLDGGDRDPGELWKTWHLPHARQACVLVEENGQNFPWGSNAKPPKGAAKTHTGEAARQALADVISTAREGSVLCLRRDLEHQKLEPETQALNLDGINEAIEVVVATGYRKGRGKSSSSGTRKRKSPLRLPSPKTRMFTTPATRISPTTKARRRKNNAHEQKAHHRHVHATKDVGGQRLYFRH